MVDEGAGGKAEKGKIDSTYLCVWIVSWLETQIRDTHLGEEDFHESYVRKEKDDGQHGERGESLRKRKEVDYNLPIKSPSVKFLSATSPST